MHGSTACSFFEIDSQLSVPRDAYRSVGNEVFTRPRTCPQQSNLTSGIHAMHDSISSPELNRAFRTMMVCIDREPVKISVTESQKILEWINVAQNNPSDREINLLKQANRTYTQLVEISLVPNNELSDAENAAFLKAESDSGTNATGCFGVILLAMVSSAVICGAWTCFISNPS